MPTARRSVRRGHADARSEEHTSELQSFRHLVCRLLLEKKKSSLNPRVTVHGMLLEPLRDHEVLPGNPLEALSAGLAGLVGLREERLSGYTHLVFIGQLY